MLLKTLFLFRFGKWQKIPISYKVLKLLFLRVARYFSSGIARVAHMHRTGGNDINWAYPKEGPLIGPILIYHHSATRMRCSINITTAENIATKLKLLMDK